MYGLEFGECVAIIGIERKLGEIDRSGFMRKGEHVFVVGA